MSIINTSQAGFPKKEAVTVEGLKYKPDYLIHFPITKDIISIQNCTCVFSIRDRQNLGLRKYVGAEYFKLLDSENITKEINGYLPEDVYCFVGDKFPLATFLNEQDFKIFGQ